MCNLLAVSSSGYYQWKRSPMRERKVAELELVAAIQAAHKASRATYGSPRISATLKAQGLACGRHRIARLMREHGIRAKTKRKFRRRENTTPTRYMMTGDLVKRKFNPPVPNQVWAGDLTHIRTQRGWVYLAVVMDLYSRRILGWAMDSKQDTGLTCKATLNAVRSRGSSQGVILHTDRGSQYANHLYQAELKKRGIVPSMGERKTCYDNAVVESFFHSLKMEELYWHTIQSRQHAKQIVFDYIERFYNSKRLHSTLDYLSPIDYEKAYQTT